MMRNHLTNSKTSRTSRENHQQEKNNAIRLETGVAKRTFAIFSAMTLVASGIGLICMNRPTNGMSSIGASAQNDAQDATFVPLTDEQRAQTESVSGTITWDDDDNVQGTRPESALVKLMSSNGSVADEALVSASDNWAYSFDGLPKYDSMDRPITYYAYSDEQVNAYATELNGYDIMNSQAADGMANVAVNIIWDDNNDQDALRPDSVEVELDRTNYDANDDTKIATLGNDTNQWSYTFTHIPQAQPDDEWFAAVHTDETTQRVYTFNIQQLGDGANRTINITCSHKPYTTTLLLRNVWHDDGTPEDIAQRPESVEMTVRDSLGGSRSYIVTADDVVNGEQWAREIELPRFNGATEIEYEIIQDSISAGDKSEEAEYEENYTPEHDKNADVNAEIGTDNEAERTESVQGNDTDEALPATTLCAIRLFVQGTKPQADGVSLQLLKGDRLSDFEDAIRAEIPKLAAKVGRDASELIGWAHTDEIGTMQASDDGFEFFEGVNIDVIYDFAVKNKGNARYVYIELRFDSPNQSVINLDANSTAVGAFIPENVAKVDGMNITTGTQNTAATLSYPENRTFPLEAVNATVQNLNANFAGWRPSGVDDESQIFRTAEEVDQYIQKCREQNKPIALKATWKSYHINIEDDGKSALVRTTSGKWVSSLSFVNDKTVPRVECHKYGYIHKGWYDKNDKEHTVQENLEDVVQQRYDFDKGVDHIAPALQPKSSFYVWAYAQQVNGKNPNERYLVFFKPDDASYQSDGNDISFTIKNSDGSYDRYVMSNEAYSNNDEQYGIGDFDIVAINSSDRTPWWQDCAPAQMVEHVKVYDMASPATGTVQAWFSDMPQLKTVDLSGFDMSGVDNVTALFANTSSLEKIYIPVDFNNVSTVDRMLENSGTANMTIYCKGEPNMAQQVRMQCSPTTVFYWTVYTFSALSSFGAKPVISLPSVFANYSRSGFVVHHKSDSADKGQGRTLGDKKLVLTVHHRAKKIYGNTPSPAQIAYVALPSDDSPLGENNDFSIAENATPESYGDGSTHSVSGLGDAGVLISLSVIVGVGAVATIAMRRRKR